MRENELVGNPIALNVAVEKRLYYFALNYFIKLSSEISLSISELFQSNEVNSYFGMDESFISKVKNKFAEIYKKSKEKIMRFANEYVVKSYNAIKTYAKNAVRNSVTKLSGLANIKMPDPDFNDTEASLHESRNLFESVQYNLIKDVETSTFRILSENSFNKELAESDILDDISKRTKKALSRVKNISETQTTKAFNIASRECLIDLGITKFKWIYTYRSHHNREYHEKVLNGNVYDINNPPVIQVAPEVTGYPAQLPNCKCKMAPVIKF